MTDFRKWQISFEDAGTSAKHLPAPPGFDPAAAREVGSRSSGSRGGEVIDRRVIVRAKQEAMMGRATSAFKSVALLAFMMWMSGSQLHIFSIMSTMSGVYQPLSAIWMSGEQFKDEEDELDTRRPQLLFCLIQLAGLAYALHRLNGMGLLPTHLSDFASYFTAPQPLEHSAGVVL